MHNLDSILKIYFKNTTAKEVLEGTVSYNKYPPEVFQKKAMMYMKHYSDTENEGLYEYAQEYFHAYAEGAFRQREENVFCALANLADNLLIMQESKVVCRYERFVRWRDVTTDIDETNLICAFLAQRTASGMECYRTFLWDNTIGHNNTQLNRILQRGLADNHFHLFGSAPVFELSWIQLMQNVNDKRIRDHLKKIDRARRSSYTYNSVQDIRPSLESQHLQAVLIRAVLTLLLWEEQGLISSARNLLERYGYADHALGAILRQQNFLMDEKSNIQALTEDIKNIAAYGTKLGDYDYALYGTGCNADDQELPNLIFSGDRWLIYSLLKGLYSEKRYNDRVYDWLYAYLLIKADIRSEIVQINDNIGLDNFIVYSKRKSGFLNGKNMVKNMIENAVFSDRKNMKSLEIRISPQNTAYENAVMISEYIRIIGRTDGYRLSSKEWFYFVFHFSKCQDQLPDRENYTGESCRHYQKRSSLKRQAHQIIRFRNQYPGIAGKVLGIDACSQEIGCRPEVFATIFRRLGQHVCEEGLEYEVPQLKKTYHVGEEFLDIADGLRAIEECVRFLNMQCGDRIGHGTVLGIDVHSWYKVKHNTIIIPVQDYLDNVAWMYNKIIEFQIEGCDILRDYLNKEFDFYFTELYEKNIRSQHLTGNNFNIYNHYNAWKLRGDEPSLYIDGRFSKERYQNAGRYVVDHLHRENRVLRHNEECSLLYYYYHYSWDIRSQGTKRKEIHIPQFYIDGIEKLQKAMQNFVSERGIGIETNPTSNYLISVMNSYEEHPILRFYNKGLDADYEEKNTCPQLFVSVNTDDKGIFRTSLENEFSYLAASLESEEKPNGEKKYNRQMVYQWIDDIREMGIEQSFLGNVEEN